MHSGWLILPGKLKKHSAPQPKKAVTNETTDEANPLYKRGFSITGWTNNVLDAIGRKKYCKYVLLCFLHVNKAPFSDRSCLDLLATFIYNVFQGKLLRRL